MSYVFKQIDPNEIYVTPFYAHKTYRLNNTNASGSGVFVYQAEYSNDHIEITRDAPEETATDEYKFAVHASLKNTYYNDFRRNPYGNTDYHTKNEVRYLHEKATSFSVPQDVFGERIKKGSVEATIAGNAITDDTYGNLIDTARETISSDLKTIFDAAKVCEYNFDEGYVYGIKLTSGKIENNAEVNLYASSSAVYFRTGSYGSHCIFSGTDSIVKAPHQDEINFNTDDEFLISGIFTFPISQSYLTPSLNTVVKKGETSPYPFAVEIFNTGGNYGQLKFTRDDGQSATVLTSSVAVSDEIQHHISFRKTSTDLELYIDGVLDATTPDICQGDTINSHSLYLGENLSGSIDEFKIFNDSFTQTQVENFGLYESGSNWNYKVGNVFYNNGLIVITSPYTEYAALTDDTGSYTLEARGTRQIEEWELLCTVNGSEFNMPTNPSCTLTNGNYASFVTHSDFNPYVTQIGLYNDNNDLLAIAKPSQPIRKPETMDLTFAIRFDT